HRHLSSFPTRRSSDLLKITLHGIDADGERVLKREILAVLGEDWLEVSLECHVLANKDLVADGDRQPKTLVVGVADTEREAGSVQDRKSTRLNSSHDQI